MMLHLEYDITDLRGAEYNPRRIEKGDLERLAESIKRLGLVKPLIVHGDLLVAGHQRTTALRHLGITKAPIYLLPCATTQYDEIRFNQLHNGTDMDSGDEECRVEGLGGLKGFVQVGPEAISGNLRATMAYVRKNIADLIRKYGNWGSCVATESGKVIHCAQYALAAKATGNDLTVYVIPDAAESQYSGYLNGKYGVFSYSHLKKTTYIQTYAQMRRLRNGGHIHSSLYDNLVIPTIRKKQRGIDFGSGQGDYARMLRNQGFALHDVELFRRKGSSNTIDVGEVHSMIDKLIADLKAFGRYDYVVCDSVLNSVDCPEAESAVLTMIQALCRAGGTVYFSGRSRETLDEILRMTQAASHQSRLTFVDDGGFTGMYRKGHWFYQRYHSRQEVAAICASYGFEAVETLFDGKGWFVMAKNTRQPSEAELRHAVEFEFELPLPNGRIGRSDDVLAAFEHEGYNIKKGGYAREEGAGDSETCE